LSLGIYGITCEGYNKFNGHKFGLKA
jgi:hypothetical protein